MGASLKNYLYLDFGSAIEFLGTQLEVENSFFRNNSGKLGGAIFVNGNNEGSAQINVKTSIFTVNFAYQGAGIGFSNNLINLKAWVSDCSFINNYGGSGKY